MCCMHMHVSTKVDRCEARLQSSPGPTRRCSLNSDDIGDGGAWAIADALAARGVSHVEMPATPYRIWKSLQEAAGRS